MRSSYWPACQLAGQLPNSRLYIIEPSVIYFRLYSRAAAVAVAVALNSDLRLANQLKRPQGTAALIS